MGTNYKMIHSDAMAEKKRKRTLHIRILRSMLIMITLTLFCTCGMYSFVAYNQTMRITKDSIRQEADYLAASVEDGGIRYLQKMDLSNPETRVTLVDDTGTVLYDSKEQGEPLGNHADRPEIQRALEKGVGEHVRKSDTVGQEMYYYAFQLQDGNILRVSKSVETAFYMAKIMIPIMGLIGIIMFLLAAVFAKVQSARLVNPINQLDLEKPLENDIYEELTPLLESINRQNEEKDAIANMRKEFTANVSHELKTPLTSISGYAEIMKSGLVKNEDMQGFSERIYQEASRLILLIEDIIKLSRLDEGNVNVEKEDVDLYELCREICGRLSSLYQKKDVKVELVGEAVCYFGIRPIIDEMVYNICENAIKYNKIGGLVKIWVGKTLQGISIIVSDTGIGIPEEDMERIFERFYRVDKSHSKETGGTGLGLSIAKHGAMLHGIEIMVESEVGRGTRMELKF